MPAQRHLTNLTDRSAAFGAAKHSQRAAALTAATTEINEAADAGLAALRKEIGALEDARNERIAAAAEAIERTRRARAKALLAELHAPAQDSLATLVHNFRISPSRAGALAIHKTWARFHDRAMVELGGELSTQVLGGLFVDDIIAMDPSLSGAINKLSDAQFSCADRALAALQTATRANATPQAIEDALTQFEDALLYIAHQHRDTAPVPDLAAMHALRREHATHRDLVLAREELGKKQGERRAAEFARTYRPPPTLREFLSAQVAALNGQT